ncbi:hypothetical protein JOL79_24155 [Microbispora sp. RL4-1S]|uniref:Uncharacterized protein n=1 Tax=Microbispora oryzae TaxID=2806554 RepID=A0A940WT24_9ACTN|nr:hypothetical protein [Microbispora oryzae]MBP2706905.1 hypothetical protein [Microbispora oryzae]
MHASRLATATVVAFTGFAALAGLTTSAQAAHAATDPGEVTVVLSNGRTLWPQGVGYVLQKCPSTQPYVVRAGVSSTAAVASDQKFQRYDHIYTSDDGRSVRVDFRNTQTYQEAAAMKRDVTVSVTLTVTCSNVDHGKPTGYDFSVASMVPPGGSENVTAQCPADNYSLVLNSAERHSDGLTVTGHHEGLHGDTYSYRNDDPLIMGSATVTVTCG